MDSMVVHHVWTSPFASAGGCTVTQVPAFPGQPVLVIGLSRCGTSYLASFLSANGVSIGADLQQAGAVNPRGFFEERTVVDFHKRILARTDLLGARVPLLASSIVPAFDSSDKEEAVRILESLARPGPWGWKDPRTLLFIDSWLSLLPNAKLIIPIRHPLENYSSYWKRIRVRPILKPYVFFKNYARQCERILEVVRQHASQAYVFDAQTGYRNQQLLANELTAFLEIDQSAPSAYPVFHESEFTRLRLSQQACDTFARHFPAAAGAFDQLNRVARIQFRPLTDSSRLDPLWSMVGAVLSRMGDATP
ncbi:MAG TPA: sulfotransferase [Bryobacteraceae bacterium]|nr:sulfotransferase [Bryobacteraceae bacterium]